MERDRNPRARKLLFASRDLVVYVVCEKSRLVSPFIYIFILKKKIVMFELLTEGKSNDRGLNDPLGAAIEYMKLIKFW